MTQPDLARILSAILKQLAAAALPGTNCLTLESLASDLIKASNVTPYNQGYHPDWAAVPFPNVLCLCVNDEIGHGYAKDRILNEGDLVSLDIGIKSGNVCADAALTVPVGRVSEQDQRLLKHARRALYEGINKVKPGVHTFDVGKAIADYAKRKKYVVNESLIGHGIGEEMHEDPGIPHFGCWIGTQKFGQILKVGQVICLEPMLTYQDSYGYIADDGWTRKTIDGRKSAFFEHMIEVTPTGYKILTDHISYE